MLAAMLALPLGIPTTKPATVAADTVTKMQNSCGWSFNPSDFSDTMTMTAYVTMDGAAVSSGTLGAFIGGSIHGLASSSAGPPFGPYAFKPMYPITMYDNAADATISYKLCYNGVVYTAPTVSSSAASTFVINGNVGNAIAPIVLAFTSPTSPSPPPPSPPPPTSPPPLAGCSSWSFDMSAYGETMTFTAYVTLDGAATTGTLAAFAGDSIRSLTVPTPGPPFGPYAFKPLYQGMIYSDESTPLTYKLCVGGTTYDQPSISIHAASTFVTNANVGNAVAPVVIDFTSGPSAVDRDPNCGSYLTSFPCVALGSYACSNCAATCASIC